MERPKLSIRSTKGCWTCRLRKKKCDEIRPGCDRCASVNIECHYGSKPSWIEDPELGKEELARVKAVVSVVANRKRAEHRARTRAAGGGTMTGGTASKSNSNSVGSYPSPTSPRSVGQQLLGEASSSSTVGGKSVMSLNEAVIREPASVHSDASWLSSWIKDQEANLIMHYLDHVHFIQFQFHTPVVAEGGRGWILSLLTRTKPLYHAALSLSAFHQQSLMVSEQGEDKKAILIELGRQHNLALKELQVFIQAESLTTQSEVAFERSVQILACIVQLISFELFNGGRSNWQFHLKAATEIVLMLHGRKVLQGPDGETSPSLSRQSPIKTGLRFLVSCIVYFDILATVSTGVRANLADHHHQLILGTDMTTGPILGIHTVFGAHNWVILIISEISSLAFPRNDWRTIVDDKISFQHTVQDIESRLVTQHRNTLQELRSFRVQYGGLPPYAMRDAYNKHLDLVVTCIFSSAAIVYLHGVKNPSVQPADIQSALNDAKETFGMLPAPRMIRALVWPLSVIACMASSMADRQFFRDLIMSAIQDSRTSGNSAEVLAIVEKSWGMQSQSGKLIDCATTIRQTGNHILLV